jgi:cell division protein FtsZ
LQGAVQGIAELITRPGLINVDFADVRTVMSETGMAMMGSGTARGENRAREAAEAAVSSPLLEDVNLSGAHGLLINVTGGPDVRISEFSIVGDTVKKYASEDANVVVGCVIDPEMREEIRVTVVATGIGRPEEAVQPQPDVRRMTAVTGGRPPQRQVPTLDDLSVPTYIRQQRELGGRDIQGREHAVPSRRAVGDGLAHGDDSLLDIPAFLRRQAD